MKTIRALVFFAAAAAATAVWAAEEAEDFEFRTEIYNGSIGIAITGYTGKAKEVVIPGLVKGFPVTVIDDGAFKDKGLTAVEIPSTVRKIGKESFKGNKLDAVAVPKNLVEIESDSFDGNLLVNVPELGTKLRGKAAARRAAELRTAPAKQEGPFAGGGGKPAQAAPPAAPSVDRAAPAAPRTAPDVTYRKPIAPPMRAVESFYTEDDDDDDDDDDDESAPDGFVVPNLELVGIEAVPKVTRYRMKGGEWRAENEGAEANEPYYAPLTGPEASRYPAYPPQAQADYRQAPQAASTPAAQADYRRPPQAAYPPPAQADYRQPPQAAYAPPAQTDYRQPQAASAPPAQADYRQAPPAVYAPPAQTDYRQPQAASAPPAQTDYRRPPAQTDYRQTPPADYAPPAQADYRRPPQADSRQTPPAAPVSAGAWTATLDQNGTVSLTGGGNGAKILVIPFSVDGKKVYSVAPGAFAKKALQSVTFASGIGVIGERAFASNSLRDVIIPSSARDIGAAAFEDNPLRRVKIGDGVRMRPDSFPAAFADFYAQCDKKAGTYSLNNGRWEFVAFTKLAYDSM